jgi:superfamily II DNA or RNA helicase
MFDAVSYTARRMTKPKTPELRPYQKLAIESVRAALKRGGTVLFTAPVGGSKPYCLGFTGTPERVDGATLVPALGVLVLDEPHRLPPSR